jgi:hypothetical protein
VTSAAPAGQSLVYDAMTLADLAGISLDAESRRFLLDAMDTGSGGRWVTQSVSLDFEPAALSAIFDVRLLAGLFLLGERVLHLSRREPGPPSAFRRIAGAVTGSEELSRRVKGITRAKGAEAIELATGGRARFITEVNCGRGFAADCLIVDHAGADVGALLPVMAGRLNPQVWYAGAW